MEQKLDPKTQNNDIGLYPVKARWAYKGTIASDIIIGEICTWIRAINGGSIVYRNPVTKENNIEYLQDGEKAPILFDKIYVSATVDGVIETTTASNVIYYTTPAQLGD